MSETILVLPKETSKALRALTGEARPEMALTLVMRGYARQKLAELEAALQQFETRHQMAFADYQKQWETTTAEADYAYEAEQEYLEWGGLVARYERLKENFAWLP